MIEIIIRNTETGQVQKHVCEDAAVLMQSGSIVMMCIVGFDDADELCNILEDAQEQATQAPLQERTWN